MTTEKTFIGDSELYFNERQPQGDYVQFGEDWYYKIANVDQMDPFFMSIVSPSDHWMFVSSNGGITAGRKNAEHALFPYYTSDKIKENANFTGSKTIIAVRENGQRKLWYPFSERYAGAYRIERNLYKNEPGNRLTFEEINHDLKLCFTYEWTTSEKFGLIKISQIRDLSDSQRHVEILDGIENILPADIDSGLQVLRSNLVDGYRLTERIGNSSLASYGLGARIIDRAEPSESMLSNTVWSAGNTENAEILLSSRKVSAWEEGRSLNPDRAVRGTKGSYFVSDKRTLAANESQLWILAGEVDQSAKSLAALERVIRESDSLVDDVLQDVVAGTINLSRWVGLADGLQISGEKSSQDRHFANVLFNIMRGGVFKNGYTIEVEELKAYIKGFNTNVNFDSLQINAKEIPYSELIEKLETVNDPDLIRLTTQFLPLVFSRRHGDPSRPWNAFTIGKVDSHSPSSYEGNWRDIFQNWEALAYSYPYFIFGMIHKFLNSSTIDGYNPYRITNDGIDWEVVEPNDPWSFIGYWGDHQIVYLSRLIKVAQAFFPNELCQSINEANYVYADVPYRIHDYADIVNDPSDTIDYDHEVADRIQKRVRRMGEDGKLVMDSQHSIVRASLMEKLFNALLAKLSNFVPDGGIWMNTQRPEWNDANNALVGNGLSLVTVGYMITYVEQLQVLLESSDAASVELRTDVHAFLESVMDVFHQNKVMADRELEANERRFIIDALGKAGETYRQASYGNPSSDVLCIEKSKLIDFLSNVHAALQRTMKTNKRADTLSHSYNLLTLKSNSAEVGRLYLMLEGQVSAISSENCTSQELLGYLKAMRSSALYREDQNSYMLYPNREMPGILEKGVIDANVVSSSSLIEKLLKNEVDALVERDVNGVVRFKAELRNADDVRRTLQELAEEGHVSEVKESQNAILHAYEDCFNHHAFTGRSGTFFAFEGLGSIYWHMVSKLQLVVMERVNTYDEHSAELLEELHQVKEGIGANKSPKVYGAFPTDPYSHTPAHMGAQQPGMTGQVKEDVLSRWVELGVQVTHGQVHFNPRFIRSIEQTPVDYTFRYIDAQGRWSEVELEAGGLAFTFMGVPVLYQYVDGQEEKMTIETVNGDSQTSTSFSLDASVSKSMFERAGEVRCIVLFLSTKRLIH